MNSLMLYRSDHLQFDVGRLTCVLSSCSLITLLREIEDNTPEVRMEIVADGETLFATIGDSRKAFFVDSCSDIAIEIMLIVWQQLNTALRLCDTGYSFDILLQKKLGVDEIKECMRSGQYDESL